MTDNGTPHDTETPAPAPRSSSHTDAIARAGVDEVKGQLRDMDKRFTAEFQQLDQLQQRCTSSQIETARKLGEIGTDITWIKKDREERIERSKEMWAWVRKWLLKVGVPAGAGLTALMKYLEWL